MKVWLDNTSVTPLRPTLAGAIEACKMIAEKQGRVITEVKLNGESLGDDLLDEPGELPIVGGEMRCATESPKTLIRQSFLEVAHALVTVRTQQEEVAGLLASGELPKAFDQLGDVLGVYDAVNQVATGCPSILNTTLDELMKRNVVPAHELTASLARDLAAIKQAIEAQDFSTVADLLTNELDVQAMNWEDALRLASADLL